MKRDRINEILTGTILGDACVVLDRGKYPRYKLTAKDKNFLEWLASKFEQFKINCSISPDNKVSGTFALWFYINTCPYPEFSFLKNKWYKQQNGKTIKIIPKDLQLNPKTLLHWYLGDGSLVRRRNDPNRLPQLVLATNCFKKEDIEFLIERLKILGLNFYSNPSFREGKKDGYVLYATQSDSTIFKFFKLIDFECPKEIANCSVGNKGIYREEKFFKDKWPTEEDWIKILSNVKEVAKILKKKRKQLDLTQREVVKLVGISREHVRDVENGRRCASTSVFRKILKTLNLDIMYLLKELKFLDGD